MQNEDTSSENPFSGSNKQLNWLRAAVLGANDGIVSIAALTVGIAGAANSSGLIFTVGIAGLIAGALSMAVGEYVSVSSQLDVEEIMLENERRAHAENPAAELRELAAIYEHRGLSAQTAQLVAAELSEKDAFKAHVDAELGLDPDDLVNPLQAGLASAISFAIGGIIPLVAIVFSPGTLRVPATFVAVLIALILTGTISAKVSGTGKIRATVRVVIGGMVAMAITFAVGKIFGVSKF